MKKRDAEEIIREMETALRLLLVAYCRERKNVTALEHLYEEHDDEYIKERAEIAVEIKHIARKALYSAERHTQKTKEVRVENLEEDCLKKKRF